MPQMAPLNWLTLFIYFTLIFLMFNSLNYFSFMYLTKSNTKTKKNIKLNWKW